MRRTARFALTAVAACALLGGSLFGQRTDNAPQERRNDTPPRPPRVQRLPERTTPRERGRPRAERIPRPDRRTAPPEEPSPYFREPLGDLGARVRQRNLDAFWLSYDLWRDFGHRRSPRGEYPPAFNLPGYFADQRHYGYPAYSYKPPPEPPPQSRQRITEAPPLERSERWY